MVGAEVNMERGSNELSALAMSSLPVEALSVLESVEADLSTIEMYIVGPCAALEPPCVEPKISTEGVRPGLERILQLAHRLKEGTLQIRSYLE